MKSREELEMLVDALGDDLNRVRRELKGAELRERAYQRGALQSQQRIEDQELRIRYLKRAAYTALGKLHVIHSAAASVIHWRKRYLDHPDELTERMTCIIDSRLIAHEALAEDGRIQDATDSLDAPQEPDSPVESWP